MSKKLQRQALCVFSQHIHSCRTECDELQQSKNAPFDQILEYECWIARLEATEGSAARARELREVEIQSEREELQERIDSLGVTLSLLLRECMTI